MDFDGAAATPCRTAETDWEEDTKWLGTTENPTLLNCQFDESDLIALQKRDFQRNHDIWFNSLGAMKMLAMMIIFYAYGIPWSELKWLWSGWRDVTDDDNNKWFDLQVFNEI